MSPDNSEGEHNYSEAVGTRLSPRTKRQFDDYKEEHEIGNAEALRRLVRQGLEAENDNPRPDVYATAFTVTAVVGIIMGVSGQLSVLETLFFVGVGVLGVGIERYSTWNNSRTEQHDKD